MRAKHAKKLRGTIEAVAPQLRRRLKRSASKLERAIEKAQAQADSAPDKPAEAMARAIELSQDLKTPPRLDKRNLHPFRLKVKKLRYILQLADTSDQQRFVAKLGEVKDAIGEWHDWEELIAIASDSLDHGSECKLVPTLQGVSDAKLKHALALTTHMREMFLESKSARRARGRKMTVLKPAVLAATSTMSA
jgi:CHAD domain-containing protein